VRVFGFEITRRKAAVPSRLSGVDDRGAWRTLSNFWPGQTWQNDVSVDQEAVTANWAVFSCITLIAGDIGKVNLGLVRRVGGIWAPADSPAFSPVLAKPNRHQTWQQFCEQWVTSKLRAGNAYILKERDARGVVVRMYVLDPQLVLPLVAPDGSVYYQLGEDDLSGLPNAIPAAPASEIIHDRMNCLFHPLVGLSPMYASGLAATQGLKIQANSAQFFSNMSRPSGILTAPQRIADETAERLKKHWEENYSGDKIGKVAVLGDGLAYSALSVDAERSQMTEQLKATAEMVCSTFHVPAFKIGAGTIPAGQKVEDLNQIYYADCLQALMDAIQTLLVYGLGLDTPKDGTQYGVRFDLDDLLKMDSATLTNVLKEQSGAGLIKLDEGRRRLNLPPMTGGGAAYLQQQNYSVEALSKRDASADPFGKTPAAAPPAPPPAPPDEEATKAIVAPLVGRIDELVARHADVQTLLEQAIAGIRADLVAGVTETRAAAERIAADGQAQVEARFDALGAALEPVRRDLAAGADQAAARIEKIEGALAERAAFVEFMAALETELFTET